MLNRASERDRAPIPSLHLRQSALRFAAFDLAGVPDVAIGIAHRHFPSVRPAALERHVAEAAGPGAEVLDDGP